MKNYHCPPRKELEKAVSTFQQAPSAQVHMHPLPLSLCLCPVLEGEHNPHARASPTFGEQVLYNSQRFKTKKELDRDGEYKGECQRQIDRLS